MVKMENKWHDGDLITLKIPMRIRTEKRFNNATSIIRGPLYYSLRIGKKYKKISLNGMDHGLSIFYKGSVDWEIRPATPWNYGLILNDDDPGKSFSLRKNPITKYPFSDIGEMVYNDDLGQYQAWEHEAPVVLEVKGKIIPDWIMKNNSSDDPPKSPVISKERTEKLELVPYGCTRLRITEFPTIM